MGLSEEPKISEEGGPSDGPTTPKYEQPHDSFSDEDLHDDEETGLTDKERRKRQKKRRRNTLLDQRIARDRKLSADEQKEADKTVMKRLLVNGGLILMWYLFSLSISLVSPFCAVAVPL
jgi:solute carrier family 35 protein C2